MSKIFALDSLTSLDLSGNKMELTEPSTLAVCRVLPPWISDRIKSEIQVPITFAVCAS